MELKGDTMQMVLMSAGGISTMFEVGNKEALDYWMHRFVFEKGLVPEVRILNEGEVA